MAHSIDGRRWRFIGVLLAALCLVVVSGCKKSPQAENESEATPVPTPSAPSTPATAAAATPTPAPVPAATPKPELAPPGIYYLVTSVSMETSDGILGLKPGQMVKEVKPGLYQADANQVNLRPDQITNDLAIARRVATQDQMNQTALRQRLAAPSAHAATPGRSTTGGPAVPPQDDPKVAARKELQEELNGVSQAMQQTSAALGQAAARWGGSWDAAAKKSPAAFQLLQQYNALQQQQRDISAKMSSLP